LVSLYRSVLFVAWSVFGQPKRRLMDAALITLFAGLGGALLGGAASVATVYIQSNGQRKRELLKMATDVALKDYEMLEAAAVRTGRPYDRMPIVLHMHYHAGLLKLIYDGEFNEATYEQLVEENGKLWDQVKRQNPKKKAEEPK